MIQGTISLV